MKWLSKVAERVHALVNGLSASTAQLQSALVNFFLSSMTVSLLFDPAPDLQ